jgi:hypothetical protein
MDGKEKELRKRNFNKQFIASKSRKVTFQNEGKEATIITTVQTSRSLRNIFTWLDDMYAQQNQSGRFR